MAPLQLDDRLSSADARDLIGMLIRIATVVFIVEAAVMVFLADWNITPAVVQEGLIDATALTLVASPIIYLWATRPYAIVAQSAQTALRNEVAEKEAQRRELQRTLARQEQLLAQNEQLRRRVQQSSAEFTDVSERLLRRIGADLHDGPAQLLSLALLRLHKAFPDAQSTGNAADMNEIRGVLRDALREVRDISNGLAMPELEQLDLVEVIHLAIGVHEERTGSTASFAIGELPGAASHAMKVCAYRFVQEGLTNAYRHAGGIGQRVEASVHNGEVVLKVSDRGPGLRAEQRDAGSGLGLPGLRGRVEALGGSFELNSGPNGGTSLVARFGHELLDKASF